MGAGEAMAFTTVMKPMFVITEANILGKIEILAASMNFFRITFKMVAVQQSGIYFEAPQVLSE